jgi:hypothetical protein
VGAKNSALPGRRRLTLTNSENERMRKYGLQREEYK